MEINILKGGSLEPPFIFSSLLFLSGINSQTLAAPTPASIPAKAGDPFTALKVLDAAYYRKCLLLNRRVTHTTMEQCFI
jgi:hypothetical protein